MVSLMIRFLILLFAATGAAAAELSSWPPVSEALLSEREFPTLTAVMGDQSKRASLAASPILQAIAARRADDVRRCGDDTACRLAALSFSPEQIEEAGTVLPVGWPHEAAAINRIISVYGQGAAPRYAEIDSIAYTPDSPSFAGLVRGILSGLEPPGQTSLMFEPALHLALRLLQAQSRDEAARYWPLANQQNAASIARAAFIDWSVYPYSVILVPGAGPEVPSVALSALGTERLRLAVTAWREGLAPYLLVSGGFVHPARTRFCEAIEMRRHLREVFDVPEDAILIDPQARHTTTNIRNAAREIFDYRLPPQKPMLIVSDPLQIDYIQGGTFYWRNLNELGYQPATLGQRLSPTRIEAVPSSRSQYRDAAEDPLDP